MADKTPEVDPIINKSLSWPLAISSLFLLATTLYTVADEVWISRPYIAYQNTFAPLYAAFLEEKIGQVPDPAAETPGEGIRREMTIIEGEEEYQKLAERYEAEVEKTADQIAKMQAEIDERINVNLDAITPIMQRARGTHSALVYQIEHADLVGHEAEKEALKKRLADVEKGPYEVGLLDEALEKKVESFDYRSLLKKFEDYKKERDELGRRQAVLTKPAAEIKKQMDLYVKKRLPTLSDTQAEALRKTYTDWIPLPLTPLLGDPRIRQIHVEDVGLVDRCESCHMAVRSPFEVTETELRQVAEDHAIDVPDRMFGAFTSHPSRVLLDIHDPEQFGCSPCHGGNGMATTSVDEAHGHWKHWLWPLNDDDHMEAGCLQCHEGALKFDHGPKISEGAELFRHLGCWGCHPRANYDKEDEQGKKVVQDLQAVARQRFELEKKIELLTRQTSADDTPIEAIKAANRQKTVLGIEITSLETKRLELERRQQDIEIQKKTVAPNLRVLRAKLRPGFLPYWLSQTKDFRPTTRMPQFRMSDRHVQAISAYLWQNSNEPVVHGYQPGDAASGKEIFATRGCMACHAVAGDDGQLVGGDFASELSRVGEKVNYDYLVGWVLDPANSGHQNVLSRSVMPNLRLSEDEGRDIASYLMTLRSDDPVDGSKPDWIDDAALAGEGRDWIDHYGCFGCHDIAGFEEAGKIGTELTKEGSKPIERLDFGLWTTLAKREHWYNHEGFFEAKLADPAIFDYGPGPDAVPGDVNDEGFVAPQDRPKGSEKFKPDHRDRLKMPTFNLSEEERNALVTFLLGSVESRFPDRMYQNPTGPAKAIRDGWWVLQKYNCIGCHEIQPGVRPSIQDLAIYQGERLPEAPPSLIGEGARVDGAWLARFLRDPSLGGGRGRFANGVRPYLAVRMPTFELSDHEIGLLVNFFNALADQETPYIDSPWPPVEGQELEVARAAFVKADCLKCHVGNLADMNQNTIAPSFVVAAPRLKSRWAARWIVAPGDFAPATKMPNGLFVKDGERWILGGELPPVVAAYPGDHVELFTRYMHHMTEEEAAIVGRMMKESQGGN